MATEKDVINSDECAELLLCSTEHVEELARNGEIPGLKFGRSWIFVYRDLLDFLADKARDEADSRRSRRSTAHQVGTTRTRRGRLPPPLPVPVPGMNYR